MPKVDEILEFGVRLPPRVYRVSKSEYPPMHVPPKAVQGSGRFDNSRDNSGDEASVFSVLYCCETPTASFLESLATLRENITTIDEIPQTILMDIEEQLDSNRLLSRARSAVSDRWKSERLLTSVRMESDVPLFDLANPGAIQLLRERMSLTLIYLKLSDLDFSHVFSDNRDLTRAISRWIWSLTNEDGDPLFSGIRYRSRFDPECICLALYEGRFSIDGDIATQPITSETPGLAEAASILRLQIA